MACNNFASTSDSSLAYGVQTACGTQQTDLTEMRFTSSSLQPTAESTQSDEIVATGDITDTIRTALSYAGSIGFELSYNTFDNFLSAALRNSNTVDGLGGIRKNSLDRTYFTIEEKRQSGSNQYFRKYGDVEVGTLNLNFETGGIATGSMDLMARSATSSTTTIADGEEYTPAPQTPVYNTVDHIGTIEIDNEEVGLVSAVSITIETNKREQRALGSGLDVAGVGEGRMSVTGNMTLYFEDDTYYDTFLNDDEVSITLVLDDRTGVVHGNQIRFEMPRVKFTNVTSDIAGVDQDLTLTVEYQALRDNAYEGTIGISTLDATDV